MLTIAEAEALPGYRRAIRVIPGSGEVTALLEDDLHAMAVTLLHDGASVSGVVARMDRAPWNTCPGAMDMLRQTFEGCLLSEVTARRDKKRNCTHLHDLAVLAAAHARDAGPLDYAVFTSDPVAGERRIVLRRNGDPLWHWVEQDDLLVAPAPVAGLSLLGMRDWIATLDPDQAEAARLLQWAALVAHGRTLPVAEQANAATLTGACYSFQPERVGSARRTDGQQDFTNREDELLAGLLRRT